MPEGDQIFSAQLVLKSAGGRSILESDGPITADRVAEFAAPPERVEAVRAELNALGFDVPQGDRTTLSVIGTRALFAEVFGLEVDVGEAGVGAHATRMPDSLAEHVADVVAAPRPELMP